jgi:Fusaric acid resistance protein-like
VTPTTELNRKTTGRAVSRTGQSISYGAALAVCCFLSYKITTDLLALSRFVPRDDELLGGMWAVVATIFVFRYSYDESVRVALSRISATLFSFVLCLIYLLIFPFRLWGLAVLIAIGAIVLELVGRSEDIITADITTAVVMVVAGISPEHAWKQPILRLLDTLVGVAVGILGARIALKLVHRIPSPSPADFPQRHGESIPS